MIRVYFWCPDAVNVGHTSMQVGCNNEEYATYISWWPAGQGGFKATEGTRITETQDIELEERNADKSLEITGLDEEKIVEWWNEFLGSDKSNYQLTATNCSWAVIFALKAGGSDKYFPWFKLLERYNLNNLDFDSNRAIWRYIKGVVSLVAKGKPLNVVLKRPIIDALNPMVPVWSPDDTFVYCEHLIGGLNDPSPAPRKFE